MTAPEIVTCSNCQASAPEDEMRPAWPGEWFCIDPYACADRMAQLPGDADGI